MHSTNTADGCPLDAAFTALTALYAMGWIRLEADITA